MTNSIVSYLGLGGNSGDRAANIENALKLLDAQEGISVVKVSEIIETEPWGFKSEYKFLNCVARIEVSPEITPLGLLDICKSIEHILGREENAEYDPEGNRIYRSRPIDIDILFYGLERIREDRLVIPHPLMSERDFVMVPLRQIADDGIISAFPEIF